MDKGGIMVAQELKEMIRTRYGSLAAFCQKINMPWNTLDSILKRGVLTGSLANIKKITDELGLDMAALANGELKAPGATEDVIVYEVSRLYQKLDDDYRRRFSAYATRLKEIQEEEDKIKNGDL